MLGGRFYRNLCALASRSVWSGRIYAILLGQFAQYAPAKDCRAMKRIAYSKLQRMMILCLSFVWCASEEVVARG